LSVTLRATRCLWTEFRRTGGGGEHRSGTLRCRAGGCDFPIIDGIPSFVPTDTYVESFSTQRKLLRRVFKGYQGDYDGRNLFDDSRIPPAEFQTGVTLDAGCGYGRFCNAISGVGGRVVGVDLSLTSLRLVNEHLGSHENVALVHADLNNLPFEPRSFDRVISMGVLHHTPSTREAFRRINRFVRPNGKCCIFVYESYSLMRKAIDFHRRWTLRIPEWLLIYLLSANQIFFNWARRIPKLGRMLCALFPCDIYQTDWRLRLTADFDAYSPRYAFSHTYDEVFAWFVEDGFRDVNLGREWIWMSGTRKSEQSVVVTASH